MGRAHASAERAALARSARPQRRLSGRCFASLAAAAIAFLVHAASRESRPPPPGDRLRLLERHRRLRHQPDADRLFVVRLDLWPGVLGRAPQHPAGGGDRHRADHGARLHHRHRAPVGQLAGRAAGRRIRPAHPQHTAAAPAAVLVQRGAQGAAGFSRQHPLAGRRLSQQPRPLPAGAGARRERAYRIHRVSSPELPAPWRWRPCGGAGGSARARRRLSAWHCCARPAGRGLSRERRLVRPRLIRK